MLLAYSRRSDGEEHAVLRPKAGNRLNKLLAAYKKRRRPFFIAYLGEGVRTKLNVQFYFERPHFLFLSTATGKPRNISAIFAPSNVFFCFYRKKPLGAPEPLLVGTNRRTYDQLHQTEQCLNGGSWSTENCCLIRGMIM